MNRGALLQFWQPTAIAELLEIRAKDKLRGAVLGDTVGLGKKWEGQSPRSHTAQSEVERIFGLARKFNVDSVFPQPIQLGRCRWRLCKTML